MNVINWCGTIELNYYVNEVQTAIEMKRIVSAVLIFFFCKYNRIKITEVNWSESNEHKKSNQFSNWRINITQ